MKRILNLGAGTQSSVVMFLMERDLLPRADYAVFANPMWEGKAVYEHLEWLRERTTIPIIEVTAGNIYEDAMNSQVRGKREGKNRWASMPLYVLNHQRVVTFAGDSLWGPDNAEYIIDLDDPDEGQIKRQCTSEYKIIPIRRWIKQHIFGLEKKSR